ncbi:Carboxypeptidase C (cathepsin A) [Bryocella elongata]|uniref:Carboxypeptidase C (Cathepsin A) n=1 Tax=Bryocella elongata TaxID=863522 RepID=A0A1H5UD38_9BACT|nr:peptidase S10 [Bryocella elongata]SEF72338.1 Carboxypeptidase C (cathepsin A) [Bryocella elongata]
MRRLVTASLLPAVLGLTCSPMFAQRPTRPAADAAPAAGEAPGLPIPPEKEVKTQHEWTGGGKTIHYTASAGNLLINDNDDKAIGSMFYVAYTADGAKSEDRPVTFFYNGGPGSATIWLHMGSFSPVRVETDSPKATRPAPHPWVNNEYSLLDKSDLVFIDAPMTGFSRLAGKGKASDFAGVDQDVAAFRKFIERYITINQRWNSPKYLFGESYGTPRSAALVAALNNDGVQFNGVVLLSSILNYYMRSPGYDIAEITYLPSYAAIAWYHNKVPHTGTMQDFVQKARVFARGEYLNALEQGDMLPKAEFDAMAAKVAAFTGLSVDYVKKSHLRIEASHFRAELLRDQEEQMGRYDARFLGPDADGVEETASFDPSDTGISGPFVDAFHTYLMTQLNYTTSEPYKLSSGGNGGWDWHHQPSGMRGFGGGGGGGMPQPDTVIDLADAMRKNPALKVFSANGWFDLATPFFGTEHDLAQMMLPDNIKTNVSFGYYPAGHMVYLNVDALHQMHDDLEKWYPTALRK